MPPAQQVGDRDEDFQVVDPWVRLAGIGKGRQELIVGEGDVKRRLSSEELPKALDLRPRLRRPHRAEGDDAEIDRSVVQGRVNPFDSEAFRGGGRSRISGREAS